MTLYRNLISLWALSWFFPAVKGQGNTACNGTSAVDWYTSTVGETPCQTYQSLRQVCNPAYTVGTLGRSPPSDRCDDPNGEACCCNNIAFALSFLCLNCQQGSGSMVNGDFGINAAIGAYQVYLDDCTPNTNMSFPADVQANVCEKKVKIDDMLYPLYWSTGEWYLSIIYDRMQNYSAFTHCTSTPVNFTSSISAQASATDTTSPGSTSTKSSSPSGGATAAVVVGAVVALALAGFVIWFCHRRHRGSVAAIRQITARQMAHVGY